MQTFKKILSIFLVLFSISLFCLHTSSLSFAYVSNSVNGSSTISLKHNTNTTISTYDFNFPFGTTYFLQIGSPDYSNTFITVNSTINITNEVNTIYIAYNTSHTGVSFGSLSTYRDTSKDISITDTTRRDIGQLLYSSSNGWTYIDDEYTKPSSGWAVKLAAFSNVPTGTYVFRDTYTYTYDEDSPTYNDTYIFGLYVSYGGSSGGSGGIVENNNFEGIINNFELGNISYSEAQDYIRNTLDNALASAESTDEKQFYINEANTYLAQLDRSAGYQFVTDLDAVKQGMDSIVNSYNNGTVSVNDAINNLSTYYQEQLNSCDSIDEAQALTTVYNSTMNNLQLSYEVNIQNQMNDAFGDSNESLEDAESAIGDIFDAFDWADLKNKLIFSEYTAIFDGKVDEVTYFKSFFNYLANDSFFHWYIMFPIVGLVISALLGTYVVLPKLGGHKDD